jgi:hypothetical protein
MPKPQVQIAAEPPQAPAEPPQAQAQPPASPTLSRSFLPTSAIDPNPWNAAPSRSVPIPRTRRSPPASPSTACSRTSSSARCPAAATS